MKQWMWHTETMYDVSKSDTINHYTAEKIRKPVTKKHAHVNNY